MGQIRGRSAKLDACNIRSLSSYRVPAAGQHILVSTDNSAMQNGQGNFDAYVVGDGTTAATALALHYIADELPTDGSKNGIQSGSIYKILNGSAKNYISGKRMYQGNEVADADTIVSDFIPYTSGNSVDWNWGVAEQHNPWHLCFYDSSKNYISGAYWSAGNATGSRTITASDITRYAANAAYIRATFAVNGVGSSVSTGSNTWTPQEASEGLLQRIEDVEDAVEAASGVVDEVDALSESVAIMKTGSEKNYTEGIYLAYSGVNGIYINHNPLWGLSDFIPYTSGNAVEWKWGDSRDPGKLIVFCDANKNYIQEGYWGSNADSGAITISAADIARYAPNAAYIQASFLLTADAYVKIGGTLAWKKEEDVAGLENLDARVSQLEGVISGGGDVLSANAFKRAAIDSIGIFIGSQAPKKKNNYLCILHQSDIHGDAERMHRMIEFGNDVGVNAILATGDFCVNEWGDGGFDNTYGALYSQSDAPILPVIGNHDVGAHHKIYTETPNTLAAVGAKYITPYMTAIGGVQGGTDAGYYYKDFSDFKVRVIVLCEYETPRVPNSGNTELKYSIWSRYLSQAQTNWFIATLNGVQSDWSVIVCMHQIIDVFEKYDDEFKCRVAYSNADVTNFQGSIIQDIVDAYIARGTLSKSYHYNNADTSEVPDITASANFSAANGEFICYINGHTHNDGMGQSSVATNKQVNINVTTGSAHTNGTAVYDDLYRDENTMSQDAFNMVAFDTDKKEIRVLRIGANVSADMRRRDYACIPYAQVSE